MLRNISTSYIPSNFRCQRFITSTWTEPSVDVHATVAMLECHMQSHMAKIIYRQVTAD